MHRSKRQGMLAVAAAVAIATADWSVDCLVLFTIIIGTGIMSTKLGTVARVVLPVEPFCIVEHRDACTMLRRQKSPHQLPVKRPRLLLRNLRTNQQNLLKRLLKSPQRILQGKQV